MVKYIFSAVPSGLYAWRSGNDARIMLLEVYKWEILTKTSQVYKQLTSQKKNTNFIDFFDWVP